MTRQEMIEIIVQRLTARWGGQCVVELDINEEVIGTMLDDAFYQVRPYYIEQSRFETKEIVNTASEGDVVVVSSIAGYIDLSSYNIRRVKAVFPRRQIVGDYITDVSVLLGYQFNPIDLGDIAQQVAYFFSRPMVDELYGAQLRWRYDPITKILYIDDAPEAYVTIEWIPEPQSIDEVTYDHIQRWILEMGYARTLLVLANVRGKYTGGALNFETNASELRGEAESLIQTLKEELKTLDFSYF